MGHVLADSDEEDTALGETLQATVAQGPVLHTALHLDQMLHVATEEIDERLDEMLMIQACDKVPDDFLETPAPTEESRGRNSPSFEKDNLVTVNDSDTARPNPVALGDQVRSDPGETVRGDPVCAGDLYCVCFSDLRGSPGNRHERLMRVEQVKLWDGSEGVMVLIHDALKLGKSASFSDFAGWIALGRRDELFIVH